MSVQDRKAGVKAFCLEFFFNQEAILLRSSMISLLHAHAKPLRRDSFVRAFHNGSQGQKTEGVVLVGGHGRRNHEIVVVV